MQFDNDTKLAVWKKAITEHGLDPAKYRKDPCGAWIVFEEYGNTESIYGWEIDHIYPESLLDGKFNQKEINNTYNLRAMQWNNNKSKDNDYPTYKSVISAEGNKNIAIEKSLTVNSGIQNSLKKLYKI